MDITQTLRDYTVYFSVCMGVVFIKKIFMLEYNNKIAHHDKVMVQEACGFRHNWLSFLFFLTIVDKTGKKVFIINHM